MGVSGDVPSVLGPAGPGSDEEASVQLQRLPVLACKARCSQDGGSPTFQAVHLHAAILLYGRQRFWPVRLAAGPNSNGVLCINA